MADSQSAKGASGVWIGLGPANLKLLKLTEGERDRKPSGPKRVATRGSKCKQAHSKKSAN